MTAPRSSSLLVAALCLSGCAAAPSGGTMGRFPASPAGGTGGEIALASLPAAAGRVVAVRRIPYANGFGQEVVLDGPRAMVGENRITLQALTTAQTGLRGQGAEELRLGPPTDTEVAAEMERALPGVAMRLAAAPEQDAEGAIGYATGTLGRLSCVYAWQYLAPARPLTLLEGAAGTGVLPMSVRVRLCREQPLATVVDSLRGLRVSHLDDAAGSAARLVPSGGDALTAALGAATSVRDAETDGRPAEPAQPRHRRAREHRHPVAMGRSHRLHAVAHRGAVARRVRAEGPALSEAPPVPLPGDAAASAAPPRAPTATAALHPSGGDMPMPR